jgi:hypothetical protein
MNEFETFWQAYPRRVSKGTARKAFERAIRLTDMETILSAIQDYKANKPSYCDFKHPATWLNGECWCDEWEPADSLPAELRDFDTWSEEEIAAFMASINKLGMEFMQKNSRYRKEHFARIRQLMQPREVA